MYCHCGHTDGQTDRPLATGVLCHHGMVCLRGACLVLKQRGWPQTAPHPPVPSSSSRSLPVCVSHPLMSLHGFKEHSPQLPQDEAVLQLDFETHCPALAANTSSEQESSREYLRRYCSSPGVTRKEPHCSSPFSGLSHLLYLNDLSGPGPNTHDHPQA